MRQPALRVSLAPGEFKGEASLSGTALRAPSSTVLSTLSPPPSTNTSISSSSSSAEDGGGGGGGANHPISYSRLQRIGTINSECPRDLVQLRVSISHERAKVFQVLGRHVEAVEDFNEVLESCPNTPNALLRRGMSFQALARYEDAATDYETARRMRPDDTRFQLNYLGVWENKPVVLCMAGEEEEITEITGCDDLVDRGEIKRSSKRN